MLSINNTKTNRLEFAYQQASDASTHIYSTGPNAISVTNIWTHVIFSYAYQTASSATFYVNGVALAGAWTTGTGGVVPFTTVGSKEKVGTDNYSHFFAGEIADYNIFYHQEAPLSLNSREVALLAGSKIKDISQQIRAGAADGFSGRGQAVLWSLNQYPIFTTMAPTNSALDVSHYFRPATPLNGAVWTAEQVQSYPPNE